MKKYLLIVLLVGVWRCEDGADGISGVDGTDGENGLSTILYTLDEPSGDNCANGGTKIVYGIDVNSDEVLSDSEIDNSTYICNGSDGSDGEVVTDEQHPLVGIWFEGDTTININRYFDISDEFFTTSIDTSIYDTSGAWGSTESRLIFTEENYFNWGWDASNYNLLNVFTNGVVSGNYTLIDNILWMGDEEYSFELYSSNSRLRIWRNNNDWDWNYSIYFFERQ